MPRFDRIVPPEHRLPLLFVVLLSFLTFAQGFWNPQALFWDENYHIASAQKYLNGVFFMEPHPPLGKMLIAAGEALLDLNAQDDQFVGTDYATNPPADFRYAGYRLFPVLLAWLTAPLLYGIFFVLTRKPLWAMLLTLLYVLDNALLVHSRSAMLDSTMLFFSALMLYAFLKLLRLPDDASLPRLSLLFGAAFAAALATKAFALLFVLLIPILWWRNLADPRRILRFTGFAAVAFFAVYLGTWYAHFAIGKHIEPRLPDGGYYQSSDLGKAYIDAGATASPLAFPVLLKDALAFVSHYEAGVPRLDLSKADENGSPWFLWPIGARTINYRWETPDGFSYRYLYLVPNPVGWGIALIGLFLGVVLFFAPYVARGAEKSPLHVELGVFLLLYACYMAALSRIDRVMYLYHYFLPLFFTFVIVGIVVVSLQRIHTWQLTDERKTLGLLVMGVLVFLGFQVYRPFTYYEAMTDDAVTHRAILKLWDMHCVECEAPSVLARPATP